jgi:transitional endoplasmic reticulum ATPase
VNEGVKLIIPEGMSAKQAMEYLAQKDRQDNTPVAVRYVINTYPLEGAYALLQVLKQRYGFVNLEATPGFFGSSPPTMLGMEIDIGQTVQVPWGRMALPNIQGYLETGFEVKRDRMVKFVLEGEVLRKCEDQVTAIATDLKNYLKEHSVFRGKAFRVTFPDRNDGDKFSIDPSYMPKVMDLTQVKQSELIFPADVDAMVRTSVFAPILHTQLCRDNKIPLKRGILLEGPYGVGKTLTAYVTAKLCADNGWTFIYVDNAKELDRALALARQYMPCVVFAEDVDRAVDDEEVEEGETKGRGCEEILNTIDGIEAKGTEIMVVLTTNHVGEINRAMLRPGRLDAVIPVRAPDAKAVESLVRLYARTLLVDGEDLSLVGETLKGQIPAVIREAVERSKLSAIHNQKPGEGLEITADDLLVAAAGMKAQIELLTPPPADERSDEEKAADVLGKHVCSALSGMSSTMLHLAGKANGRGKSSKALEEHSDELPE